MKTQESHGAHNEFRLLHCMQIPNHVNESEDGLSL